MFIKANIRCIHVDTHGILCFSHCRMLKHVVDLCKSKNCHSICYELFGAMMNIVMLKLNLRIWIKVKTENSLQTFAVEPGFDLRATFANVD